MDDKKINILLIEDNLADSRLVEEYLKESEDFKFTLMLAGRLSEGLEYIIKKGLDIILVDLGLPDSQGIATVEKILEKENDIPVIVLTGLDDIRKTKDLLQKGIQDYLIKGQFDGHILTKSIIFSIERKKTELEIKNLYQYQKTITENIPVMQYNISPDGDILDCNKLALKTLGYKYKKELIGKKILNTAYAPSCRIKAEEVFMKWKKFGSIKNEELQIITKKGKVLDVLLNVNSVNDGKGKILYSISTHLDISTLKKTEKCLKVSYGKLQETMDGVIEALAKIVEVRDPYTSGHQKEVARLAEAIARELGLEKNKVESIKMAALIHDIGKIGIPVSILSKPGKLSDLELNMIKTHPQVSYDLIKGIKFSNSISKIVLQHHERKDGSGYPKGLKDKDILLGARILTVADVVEAMSSHRPYRAALGIDKALEEIKNGKGKLYDSGVVDVCISLFNNKFKFDLPKKY